MKPDPSSAALVPRLLRFSLVGLVLCLVGIIIGEAVRAYVAGSSAAEIAIRLVGAVLRGVGLVGTLLFLLFVLASLLFKVLAKFTSRRTGG